VQGPSVAQREIGLGHHLPSLSIGSDGASRAWTAQNAPPAGMAAGQGNFPWPAAISSDRSGRRFYGFLTTLTPVDTIVVPRLRLVSIDVVTVWLPLLVPLAVTVQVLDSPAVPGVAVTT